MPTPLHPPQKRSVTIAGHPTSISLEPMFWDGLEQAATEAGLPINALVARVDVERMEADDPPNLTSAIRQWLWRWQQGDDAAPLAHDHSTALEK